MMMTDTHKAHLVRSPGSTWWGVRCTCGQLDGYVERERQARAIMFKHIGHVPTIKPVRATGFGGRGGWAYELTCSCDPTTVLGDPSDHEFSLHVRHEDHLTEVGQ